MNKKGFASSTIIYGLLSVFLIAISILIYTMNSNVSLNKSLNEKTIENIEYGSSSISELENRIIELETKTIELEKNKNELETKINKLETKINKLETKSILEETYPVGSIYISTSSTNPGEIFGGEWQSYATGRTLVGIDTSNSNFSTVEKKGGSLTHKHKSPLTFLNISGSTNKYAGVTNKFGYYNESRDFYGSLSDGFFGSSLPSGSSTVGYYTSSETNMSPYITVYMYKRIK